MSIFLHWLGSYQKKAICLGILALLYSSNSEALLTGGKPSTITVASDSFAGTANPAGNVTVGDRVDFGVRWFHDDKHTEFFGSPVPGTNGHFDATAKKKDWFFPEVAVNKSFKTQVGCRQWNWALSLAVYTPLFNRGSYKNPISIGGTTPPSYELLDQVVSPILGVQINEKHSLGVSVDFHMFRPNIKGLENFGSYLHAWLEV